MRKKHKCTFRVYQSVAFDYARFALITMPVLCCWLANETKQVWLYGVAGVSAIITVYAVNLFAAKLMLNPNGITLVQNLQRVHISWDSIVFADIIAVQAYGLSYPVEILCFSTRKHNPAAIRKSKYLPQLSKDFVFIILADQVRSEIAACFPEDITKRLKIHLCGTDSHKQEAKAVSRNKWIALCVIYLFALLLAYILIQFN